MEAGARAAGEAGAEEGFAVDLAGGDELGGDVRADADGRAGGHLAGGGVERVLGADLLAGRAEALADQVGRGTADRAAEGVLADFLHVDALAVSFGQFDALGEEVDRGHLGGLLGRHLQHFLEELLEQLRDDDPAGRDHRRDLEQRGARGERGFGFGRGQFEGEDAELRDDLDLRGLRGVGDLFQHVAHAVERVDRAGQVAGVLFGALADRVLLPVGAQCLCGDAALAVEGALDRRIGALCGVLEAFGGLAAVVRHVAELVLVGFGPTGSGEQQQDPLERFREFDGHGVSAFRSG
ncbi:hypothetical protein [Kitasatospora setae]|uniref:hypothetical protein n=1 Tax=Kitasatospora setae TaxID=2066 RepID=UPI0012FEC28F|nr:hypothetical protein [Kitasatospora setae]